MYLVIGLAWLSLYLVVGLAGFLLFWWWLGWSFFEVLDQVSGCVEHTISGLATYKAIRVCGIITQSTALAKVVAALGDHRFVENFFTYGARFWKLIIPIGVPHPCHFIVTLFAIALINSSHGALTQAMRCLAHKLELLFLQGLFILLVKLVATFVVTTVMDEYASIAESAVPMFVVILAPFRVMVHSRSDFHESRCSLGSLQCARELLSSQFVFTLSEVV